MASRVIDADCLRPGRCSMLETLEGKNASAQHFPAFCTGKGTSTPAEAASEQLLFPSPAVHPAHLVQPLQPLATACATPHRLHKCGSTSSTSSNATPCPGHSRTFPPQLIRSLSKWWSKRLASASSPPPHSTCPRTVLLPPARTSPEEPCGCPFGA